MPSMSVQHPEIRHELSQEAPALTAAFVDGLRVGERRQGGTDFGEDLDDVGVGGVVRTNFVPTEYRLRCGECR